MRYNYYNQASEAARGMIRFFLAELKHNPDKEFNIALSGGVTPALLFDIWACEYANLTPWEQLQFYWVDERCVTADHPDNNYAMTKRLLFDRVNIPSTHIHRIDCDSEPDEEATDYSELIKSRLPVEAGVPIFDFIFLGIGRDGHTSSIFLGQKNLLSSPEPYAVSLNPYSGQYRISLTGRPLLKAFHTWFFVTGKEKQHIIHKITDKNNTDVYPAGYVLKHARDPQLFTDIVPERVSNSYTIIQ